MKKLLICMCLLLALCPLAYAQSALVTDGADLLEAWEETALQVRLEEVQEATGTVLLVALEDSLEGSSRDDYAEALFYDGNYGENGVLLLVTMDSRECSVFAFGSGEVAITDQEADSIAGDVVDFLVEEKYLDACYAFADACKSEIEAENVELTWYESLFGCIVIGFVISLIVVLCMKRQLKSVRFKPDAHSYIRSGSMQVTRQQDIYLYSHTSRTAKPKNNSSGGSSGGRSHGGATRKF